MLPVKTTPNTKSKYTPSKENHVLFDKYIMPNLATIRSLTVQYTNNRQDVEDNYNHCLTQLFKYIKTYNPAQKLDTWLHIVVKRACYHQNQKRFNETAHWTDIEMCSMEDLYGAGSSLIVNDQYGTLLDNLSDQVLAALMQISPLRLSPFMQVVQGVRIRDVVATEWKMGHLERRSEDMVKSRIFWAKKEIRFILKKYGITKASYQGS